jgi:hypothetical protein
MSDALPAKVSVRSRYSRSQTPVWERQAAKLCFVIGESKRSFEESRSQTEFGNEGKIHSGKSSGMAKPMSLHF